MLLHTERPVIVAGGGVAISKGEEELLRLAELLCIPVATGRSGGKGVISEDHPLALGTCGSFGWKIANEYIAEADCWCAIGLTFSQIAMQDWTVRPPKTLIHIDIDPIEIGKIYTPTIGIVGDAKMVMNQMFECLAGKVERKDWTQSPRYLALRRRKDEWMTELNGKMSSDAEPINPFRVMKEIRDVLPSSGIVVGGAGNNGEFAVHAFKALEPRTFILSQKYSAVGYSLPTALGAKLAAPDRPVVSVEGDGGFLYSLSELATAVMEKIPITVIVMNDGYLNANKQIADHLFEGSRVWVKLNNPDCVAVAKSFGAEGERVESPRDIRPALQRGLRSEVPYVIDMIIDDNVPAPITGKLWKIRW